MLCTVTVQHHSVRSYIDATACCVKLCKWKGVLCHLMWWGNGTLCEFVHCDSMFCEMVFVWQHGGFCPQAAKDPILTPQKNVSFHNFFKTYMYMYMYSWQELQLMYSYLLLETGLSLLGGQVYFLVCKPSVVPSNFEPHLHLKILAVISLNYNKINDRSPDEHSRLSLICTPLIPNKSPRQVKFCMK